MELNQNPLEFLTIKVQQTVTDTQNLANEIAGKVQENSTLAETAFIPALNLYPGERRDECE
ncbi:MULTISPECIES: hypothetical protein [unclassified Microcoleus]|uniref:hypothetical protein n=1 Tax=unclassified Microcoleus TaxID=2642155 RepID=UPI002FD33AC7